jgi:histidinol-phosphate aminotransferase
MKADAKRTATSAGALALAVPGVRGLAPYQPGKPIEELEREYGVTNAIKLASNENPLGPSPRALEAARATLADIARYPDGNGFALKRALAGKLGVDVSQITLGNGSNDILEFTARAFVGAGDEVVFSEHAFAVYPIVTQAVGARAVVAPAKNWGHDLDAMRGVIGERTRLVFIANPNNPTGTWLSPATLRGFVSSLPRHVIVVLDEAYQEYMPGQQRPDSLAWLAEHPNLIVCRTFSKIYGLAGLRVGYAISDPAVAELLNRVRQPFNVNELGQVAALAALGATDHVQRSRQLNDTGMARLREGLAAFGWTVPPSAGNFLLADTGGPAAPWYAGLLRAGVIVRPVANYGLPHHLRISIGLPDENERLLRALADLRRAGVRQ